MIITLTILGSVLILIGIIWSYIPNIPTYPEHLLTSLNSILDIVFDNLELLDIFIRIDTIKIVIPILIALVNLDKIYSIVIWFMNKIPLVDLD